MFTIKYLDFIMVSIFNTFPKILLYLLCLKLSPFPSYFGPRNAHPALTLLYQAGFDDQTLLFVNYTLNHIVRMPYSNNWRVQTREGRNLVSDCPGCTVPAKSGANAMRMADIMAYTGKQVFG